MQFNGDDSHSALAGRSDDQGRTRGARPEASMSSCNKLLRTETGIRGELVSSNHS
jgi:hypothetical protein